MFFFRKRNNLEFLKKYRPESDSVGYQNIDGFIGAIISEGKATLQELKTIYSLEDAFLMWEVIAINRFNEWVAVQNAKKKGGA